jgi:hypothetical protein
MAMLLGKSREIERSPGFLKAGSCLRRIDFGTPMREVAGSMKRKERYIARLDEVSIVREGEYAFIEYKEKGIPRRLAVSC